MAKAKVKPTPNLPATILATRPRPPHPMLDPAAPPFFMPDKALVNWLRSTFIDPQGTLPNPDHAHLMGVSIGALWTNVENTKRNRQILGTAELISVGGDKWTKGRFLQQLRQWFGLIPTFLLTFDAHAADHSTDAEWCQLAEHELYHCGPELDEFGNPKFDKDGFPCFAMRGHDVEEFTGVVRRYGALRPDVKALVEAANQPRPDIAPGRIAAACGTCLVRVVS